MSAVTVLCIRDPDYGNEYVSDGDVRQITIDVGGQWRSYKDFASDLQDEGEAALGFQRHLFAEVEHLEPTNPVRVAVEQFFATARSS